MEATKSILNRIDLGLEVAWRDGKTFALLLASDLPHPFFQLISLRRQPVESRLDSYLNNARKSRRIASSSVLNGEVLMLGFCDASSFDATRETARALIGPESQRNLVLNVRRKFPKETPRFKFRHSIARGLEISSTPALGTNEEIIAIATQLQKLKGVDF